jgi:hypothetical protein
MSWSLSMHEGLAPSGRGYADFHASVNFAITGSEKFVKKDVITTAIE